MEKELKDLKSHLLAIVVSSRVTVNVTILIRDYKELVGIPLDVKKFGYWEVNNFLKALCNDCFVFQGTRFNPELIPIVPEAMKHIHEAVQNLRARKSYEKRRVRTKKEPRPEVNSHVLGTQVFYSQRFQNLKEEMKGLICEKSEPVWCTNLIGEYSEKYGHEPCIGAFGCTSIVAFVRMIEGVSVGQENHGDYRAWASDQPAPAPLPPCPPPSLASKCDPDDALPGIPYEPGVFPEGCMKRGENIPELSLKDIHVYAEVPVLVGEVYSPSHFWMMRLDTEDHVALGAIKTEMKKYYDVSGDEERPQHLSMACVRGGHYCAYSLAGEWYRVVIVQVFNSDWVKVRFVDYGRVLKVEVSKLRHLRRCWAQLPAQAIRARLGGCAPLWSPGWSMTTTSTFLGTVHSRLLVAQVIARHIGNILEVVLIDTTTEEDVCIQLEMIQDGYATRVPAPIINWNTYLQPTFNALENGFAPSYGEIKDYIHHGIGLDSLDGRREHVLDALPALSPPLRSALKHIRPRSPPTKSDTV